MTSILQIVRETCREFAETHLALPFHQCGLDSFDLLQIRVRLEGATEQMIPDSQWFSFQSFADIQQYLDRKMPIGDGENVTAGVTSRRMTRINMPQMALGGLSESWLFKELGDIHWSMTCDGLNTESHNLRDELGNRLYATFVRVRIESSHHLKRFEENEQLDLEAKLRRYGRSMFFSEIRAQGDEKEIHAQLMTTFSLRQTNNKSLLKGEPLIPPGCAVQSFDSLPRFAAEYREMRKGEKRELVVGDETFAGSRESIFETTYQLNPYLDLNGVNLLYFAAYPTISDYCEMEFIKATRPEISSDPWPIAASTLARDVFYYGNCDLDDRLIFAINSFESGGTAKVKVATSLYRERDHQLIANIFSVKELTAAS